MPEATITDRVTEMIVEVLGVDPHQVTPEARFTEDLGADSLDSVELVMAVEEEFNLEISDPEAEKIQTVSALVAYLEEHEK